MGLLVSPFALHKHVATMQLFIRGTQTHAVQVTGTETVDDVKALLADREGLSVDDQVVMYAGKPLESGLLTDMCADQGTIEVALRMLGGKVHGSLARAGKERDRHPRLSPRRRRRRRPAVPSAACSTT